jgi:hypothetical protein
MCRNVGDEHLSKMRGQQTRCRHLTLQHCLSPGSQGLLVARERKRESKVWEESPGERERESARASASERERVSESER